VAILALLVLACALALGSSASAAPNSAWYWSRVTAEGTVWDEGVPWMRKPEYLDDVGCHGIGDSIRSKRGVKLFRRFDCHAVWNDRWSYSRFYLIVTGKYT
jgi:hypothetical protein